MRLLSELNEGFKISLRAIAANKLRSALTTLGIIIGILTVSLMAMAITGMKTAFMRSISVLGSDVLYVERMPWGEQRAWWKIRGRRDLQASDGKILRREAKLASAVAIEASGGYPVKYQDKSAQGVWISGATEDAPRVQQVNVSEGRFFGEAEVQGARPVCVLGADIAAKFFPNGGAIGEKIKIAGKNFEVIGVNEKVGQFLFGNMDNQIRIPLTRFLADLDRQPYMLFLVKVRETSQMADATEEVRSIMRKLRRLPPEAEDDFSVNQQEILLTTFNRVGGIIASVGLFITGLALFVGGVGIMNIMFVSVMERTREIGIRKALGAKRRTILTQFLMEAALICLLGGLIGLLLAWGISLGVQKLLPAAISPGVAALAIGMSLGTGVLAGFMPAWRAARLNPIDALRAE